MERRDFWSWMTAREFLKQSFFQYFLKKYLCHPGSSSLERKQVYYFFFSVPQLIRLPQTTFCHQTVPVPGWISCVVGERPWNPATWYATVATFRFPPVETQMTCTITHSLGLSAWRNQSASPLLECVLWSSARTGSGKEVSGATWAQSGLSLNIHRRVYALGWAREPKPERLSVTEQAPSSSGRKKEPKDSPFFGHRFF